MRPILFTVVAALAASVNGSTCQLSAYSLSCLTSNSAASSYCSSALGAATPATGVTGTSVVVVSKTVTLSDVPTNTVYAVSTKSIVSKSTTTTFVTSSSAAARRRRRRSESCGDAASILSGLDSSQLPEACSCIDAVPTDGVEDSTATSTVVITGEVWFTVSPAVTISTTQTVSTRSIETVTLNAPSFTQVWGPQNGCADVGHASADSYQGSGYVEDDVIESCKIGCSNKASCAFIYVQLEFPGGSQYYNCYINTHAFNETADIECGKDASRYGSAKGFSAIGRG